jgi:hypothetical protein
MSENYDTASFIPASEDAKVIMDFAWLSAVLDEAAVGLPNPANPESRERVARIIATHTGTPLARWLAHDQDIQAAMVTCNSHLSEQ